MQAQILAPAAILILWSLVMLIWVAATRFPAMAKSGMNIKQSAPGGRGNDLDSVLPAQVNWKSHNYTHLMEQPTIFYATVMIRRVGIDAPVGAREVFVDRRFHVHQGLAVGTQRGVALTIDDVGARCFEMVGGNQGVLDHVLNVLNARRLAVKTVDQHLAGLGGEQRGLVGAEFARCRARALQR